MTSRVAEEPRLKELDGLRAVAITVVMLLHYRLLSCGWVGVQLFFVLSGTVITRVLQRTANWPAGAYFARFYRNRVLRIFPAYFLYLGVLGLFWLVSSEPAALQRYAFNLVTFTFNLRRMDADFASHPAITPLWSLCVEEQFYLLWPVVFLLTSPRVRVFLCLGLVALGPLIRAALLWWLSDGTRPPEAVADTIYWMPVSHLDAFACGALVAAWLDARPQGATTRAERRLHRGALAAVCVAGALNLVSMLRHGYVEPRLGGLSSFGYPLAGAMNLQPVWCYTLLNVAAASTMVLLCRADGLPRLARVLRWQPLQRIGQVSFGMYLVHWGIGYAIQGAVGHSFFVKVLTFLPYFALVYGIAHVSFHAFEKRVLAFRTGLSRGAPAGPPRQAPAGAASNHSAAQPQDGKP